MTEKSLVGVFQEGGKAPSDNPTTIYEQQLNSSEIGIAQNTSQVDTLSNTSSEIAINNNSSEAQSNKGKPLPLLDLDKAGWNTIPFRDKPSVLSMSNVNTDSEYGTLRGENKYDLSETAPEIITASTLTRHQNPFYIGLYGKNAAVTSGLTVTNVTGSANATFALAPHIFYGKLDASKSTRVQVAMQDIALSQMKVELGSQILDYEETDTLDGNFEPKENMKSPEGIIDDNGIEKIEITISNSDTEPMEFGFSTQRSTGGTTVETENVVETLNAGEIKSIVREAQSGWTDPYYRQIKDFYIKRGAGNKRYFKLEYVKPSYAYYSEYRLTMMVDGEAYTSGIKETVSGFPDYNVAPVSRTNNNEEIPVSFVNIVFKPIWESAYTASFSFSKGSNPLEKFYIQEISGNSNVYDFSWWGDKLQYMTIANSGTGESLSADTEILSNGCYLAKPNNAKAVIVTPTSMNPITVSEGKYTKVLELSSIRSIGIYNVDGRSSLCIKCNDNYYTPMDLPPKPVYTITDLQILENKCDTLAFTIALKTSGVTETYYVVHRTIGSYSGGGLYHKSYRDLRICKAYKIEDKTVEHDHGSDSKILTIGDGGYSSFGSIALDSNIYMNDSATYASKFPTSGSTSITYITKNMLGKNLLKMASIGEFVSEAIVFPVTFGKHTSAGNNMLESLGDLVKGHATINLVKVPSWDTTTDNFKVFPPLLKNEYHSIYNSNPICSKAFVIGKTRFAVSDGSLYEANDMGLVGTMSKTYISESRSSYDTTAGLIFKIAENSTEIYSFTELGLELSVVVEDKMLAKPIKSPHGLLMIGTTGLWLINKAVTRIWKHAEAITDADMKLKIDSSIITLFTDSSNTVKIVMFNGQGHVSTGTIGTTITNPIFLKVGGSDRFSLTKVGQGVYDLARNSEIEIFESKGSYLNTESKGQVSLYSISLFAKKDNLSSLSSKKVTVTIGSFTETRDVTTDDYSRYDFFVDSIDIDMSRLTVKGEGVVISSKIVGKIYINSIDT